MSALQVADLINAGNATTLAGTTATFKADPKEAELSVWVELVDGSVREYNVYTGVTVPLKKVTCRN